MSRDVGDEVKEPGDGPDSRRSRQPQDKTPSKGAASKRLSTYSGYSSSDTPKPIQVHPPTFTAVEPRSSVTAPNQTKVSAGSQLQIRPGTKATPQIFTIYGISNVHTDAHNRLTCRARKGLLRHAETTRPCLAPNLTYIAPLCITCCRCCGSKSNKFQ